MRRAALAALLALAGCGEGERAAPVPETAGAMLEAAARARGIVADPARLDPVGLYVRENDRVCVAPAADGYAIGAAIDYGEGQACRAVGRARGRAVLAVDLGAGCRFEARVEADRIVFPAVLPADCAAACRGRASLAALTAQRRSGSAAEARGAIGPDGRRLCPAT